MMMMDKTTFYIISLNKFKAWIGKIEALSLVLGF